ncbi:carboxylesterase family protein [Actinosynnema sp. NPDC047251]|uniref:Carboxylic ester hydrolase n=1 Tax=Saccharothrix espanaensis (strain ATCC 51144 / DSM 44229 / JCM 9112 / NBRC 15066 / NRRL 15764) TaxID=1179773 RepID=K0JZ35_SACES|nr:carboxylesterase family protein [Saccharothrix espanaensis]CCH30522.1 Carboxylesterase [Saccharothrix espanaensis DSM 44229]
MTRRGRFLGRAVQTAAGQSGVDVFLGIRYAEPPFGPRRFAAPVRTDFAGACTRFGPIAPQSAELPGAPVWRPGDEDVLSLNVWAPSAAEGNPVLLYLHGGAYTYGSSAQPDYDGVHLARAGLVVVTCNYRLGFEGFGHVEGHPDNRGLLDQVAALHWVRDEIAAFGGDPENITVAGQSAGAGSALFLADASRAVRRVIAHSVPNRCYTGGFARRVARWIDPTTPESAVVSADALARAQRSGPLGHDPVLFGPVADRLPVPPADVPLLLCHTTAEYRLFDRTGTVASVRTDAEYAAFGRAFAFPPHVVAGYRELFATPSEAYLALLGDHVFTEPTTRLAQARGAPLARFSRPPAWHAADVPFAFGTLAGADFLIGGPPGPAEHALSRRVLASWVGFARTGDPGWAGVRWWGEEVDVSTTRALWRGVDLDVPVDFPVSGIGARRPRRAP